MPIIDFSEYLKKFIPVKKKISSEYHLPSLVERDSALEARLEFLAREVSELYSLINQDLSKKHFIDFGQIERFKSKLESLKTSLSNYCDTICSPTRSNLHNVDKSGQQIFSELLQHLFMYVSDKYPDNKVYVNKIMGDILTNHPDDFFYFLKTLETGAREICLWEDPMQGETALISAMRAGEVRIVRRMLEKLKINFFGEQGLVTEISPAFENYFFHETEDGISALSVTWERDNPEVLESVLNFAQSIYGFKETSAFQHFIFQIDSRGTTSLMRAAERKNLTLFRLILDGMRKVYGAQTHSIFQNFLKYRDPQGLTVLNRASQTGKSKIVQQLIETATIAFSGRKTDEFKNFLNFPNNEGTSPFISAAINGHKKVLKLLFETAQQAYGERSAVLQQFIFHQDNDGFTALMRVAEHNQVANAQYLLRQLVHLSDRLEDSSNALYQAFMLKTKQGLSIFHLAVESGSSETLTALLRVMHLIFNKSTPEFHAILSQPDKDKLMPLDKIIQDEKILRDTLESEDRVDNLSLEEKSARLKRAKMAGKFLTYDIKPSTEADIPFLQRFAVRGSNPEISFFGIFCHSLRRRRVRRATSCRLGEGDYQSSFPKEARQLRQEALVNLVAFLKQANLDSIAEVALIRNRENSSPREQLELQKYSRALEGYVTQYRQQLLRQLKQQTANSLESGLRGLSSDYPYLLLDNGSDLLVLNKEHIFSGALLNPAQAIDLRPKLTPAVLKDWLASYFGPDYTVHPFDPEIVGAYPDPLESLSTPILSDATFLSEKLEGISRRTIQALFLLEKSSIQIGDFDIEDFFATHGKELTFRAENFHEVFFKLTFSEKTALKNLLLRYEFSAAQYEALSSEENEYLRLYRSKLMDQLRRGVLEPMTPIETLHAAIEVQEAFLDRESDVLSSAERQEIKDSLHQLKGGLTSPKEKKLYGKAALQLVVLLFPNAVRGIINKDPLEALTPVGLIASDMALRKLLMGFTKHPQVMKLFNGQFSSRVFGMASEAARRIPIIGSAFALYGLYESGKALTATDASDPNRPYYAHLFGNNLAMVGLMGAELAVELPFWPVLTLFALLTVDQTLTEGRRLHDNVLHLTDDAGHPFSRFLTELELGLGMVDSKIELVETKRMLFETFLAYLHRFQNKDNAYSLIAVALPEVQVEQVEVKGDQKTKFLQGTLDLLSELSIVPVMPLPLSTNVQGKQTQLGAIEKNEFKYEFGKVQVLCEGNDAFYLAQKNPYLLLAGQQVSPASQDFETDCVAGGQPKTRGVSAWASGKAGAAVVLNKKHNQDKQNHSLLLTIDPAWVSYYGVHVYRSYKPITEIVVNIAHIYSFDSSTTPGTTTINVQTKELKNEANVSVPLSIQHNIGDIGKGGVTIAENTIFNKTFAFYDKEDEFQFENDSIISKKGFKAAFGCTKTLALAFAKGVTVQGEVPVKPDRRMVIRHLQGIDDKHRAFFNATKCPSFAVSLGQETELHYKNQVISITAKNYSESIINTYAEAGAPLLYYFTVPFNHISHNITYSNGVGLLIDASANSALARVDITDTENQAEIIAQIFSGHYLAENGEKLYSRLIVDKNQDKKWQCALEINATGNNTQELDVSEIRSQNFRKVSILSKEEDEIKLSHHFFWQDKVLPKIIGQFVNYKLEEDVESYIIILKNAANNEETQLFLLKKNAGIIINNVHYQPDWSLFTLLAIKGVEGLPIDAANVLAPIKIAKTFNETTLVVTNGLYTIGGIAIKNPSNKLFFQCNDMQIPFAILVYQAKINMASLADRPAYAHYKAASQSISSEYKISEKEALSHNSSWKDLAYYFGVASAILGTGLALFSKRFRASRQVAITGGRVAANAALPLLEIQAVEAAPKKVEQFEGHCSEKLDLSFKEIYVNTSSVLGDSSNGYEYKPASSPHGQFIAQNSYTDLNPNLMLAYWTGQQAKKLFFKPLKAEKNIVRNTKASINGASYKDNATFFVDNSCTANVISHHVMVLDAQPINRSLVN